jgi:hypothetical protein
MTYVAIAVSIVELSGTALVVSDWRLITIGYWFSSG